VSQEYDKARSLYLKAQGIHEMRFWNHEILRHEQDVLEKLAERVTPSNSS
jgi:very-short-patch-repair endonuclease